MNCSFSYVIPLDNSAGRGAKFAAFVFPFRTVVKIGKILEFIKISLKVE